MDVLLVEDDPILGKMVSQGLSGSGHRCDWFVGGLDALVAIHERSYDVIVLDRMLPDMNGMEILGQLKNAGIQIPVLMLTALGSVENRIEGLELGADDYLVKPFDFAELVARLSAVTRRMRRNQVTILEVGPLQVDLTQRTVIREGGAVGLVTSIFI